MIDRLLAKKTCIGRPRLCWNANCGSFCQKSVHVVDFDLNKAKIDPFKSGVDPTKEVGDEASLRNAFLETVIFQLQRTVPPQLHVRLSQNCHCEPARRLVW